MHLLKSFYHSIIYVFNIMHSEGYIFVVVSIILFLLLSILSSSIGFLLLGIVITFAIAYFFRDPKRMIPINEGAILSMADGIIGSVAEEEYECLLTREKKTAICIRIILGITDVHINRSPIDGVVKALNYIPGSFESVMFYNLDKAKENERQEILIEDSKKREYLVVQQVGILARRIVCNLIVGQEVTKGERIGLMKFGSMMAIYLPPEGIVPNVVVGQSVIAGESVIAVNSNEKIEISYKEV